MTNPTIPFGVDLVFVGISVCVIALTVFALVSLARQSRALSGTALAIWVVAVIVAPIIASLCWFAIGLPATRKNSSPIQQAERVVQATTTKDGVI